MNHSAVAASEFGNTTCSLLKDLKSRIMEAGGGYMRGKGPKSIPWVDVRQLTVNIHGPGL